MVLIRPLGLLWVVPLALEVMALVTIPREPVGTRPALPLGTPHPPPAYMKDNVNNYFGTAPDHGSMKGPVLESLNSSMLVEIHGGKLQGRANSDDYWLSTLGSAGQMPFAPPGYQFFRNVKDFGAVGDGVTDDTAAINRAAATYGLNDLTTLRCGADCGSTTTLGAVVYFPPGTYLISTPIVQYYYTQFIGNPTTMPTIKGSFNFTGIALFDSDFYISGGNGAEWYINQNNFYRQIRNFVFNMTGMNWTNTDNGQQYVPAGIHWQVGQATSITNCDFQMAVSTATQSATAVGIYMENGSGGFVSDLTFTGGNIGFLAGSQQFTASNLQFTSCLTAIKHVWNWGFTWKNIYVLSCYIALDCTEYSGVTGQGTGSISVVDSHFNGVPYAITVADLGNEQPNIVLDNLLVEASASVVLISGGATILEGSTGALYFNSWANGYQYLPDGSSGKMTGFIDPVPDKASALLDSSGAYFRQAKPQYETETPVSATDNGVSNDATGDQTDAINTLLSSHVGSVIFFPAGIYMVTGVVKIPVGSRIVGSGWSQIMGTGPYFEDANNTNVMVQVGNEGDQGIIEISDMLFTVKGATAGAILMEWNVHESTQGSAAMWDSHFRVGGANGTNLQLGDCPAQASSVNPNCMAASLLMHVTSQSSGYFENVWAWVADHDLDNPLNAFASESNEGIPYNVGTDISIYAGRGILIESQGPTWMYGTAAEHSQLYQYQLYNASAIYLGHMQTETPYYQPNPNAQSPYASGQFPGDPTFANCADDLCKGAWALRVVNSSDVYIYSAGFYSFFQNNGLGCTAAEDCQLALIETNYVTGLWIYNIFTKGNVQIVSPAGGLAPLMFNSTTKDGYTSEIAAWLALSTGGGDIGNNGNGSSIVTIDPIIWSEPTSAIDVSCLPPCTYVLPPVTLPTNATFVYPPLVTPLEVGWITTTSYTYLGNVTTSTFYVTVTITTTITIPPVTTSVIPVSNVVVTVNSTVIDPEPSIIAPAFNITDPTVINGTTIPPNTRPFYPPPWPGSSLSTTATTTSTGTSTGTTTGTSPGGGGTNTGGFGGGLPHVTHHNGPPFPICIHATGCGVSCTQGIVGLFLQFFHVCSQCWVACGGFNSPNFGDSNDPNNPNNPRNSNSRSSTSSCSTATYSSCSTACVSESSTSSCSSTCKEIIGCDTTGSAYSTIFTPAPYFSATFEDWSDFVDTATAADWTAGMVVWSEDNTIGASSTPPPSTASTAPTSTSMSMSTISTMSTSTSTTSTSSTAWPTNTAINVGSAYCFTSSMGYVSFTESQAQAVVQAFCNANYVLDPSNTYGQVEEASEGSYSVVVSASWASDQSGCGTMEAWSFAGSTEQYDLCLNAWSTDYFCVNENAAAPTSYGGGYVYNTGNGCILLENYAYST